MEDTYLTKHGDSFDEDLPRRLANLRYDVLADFLREFASELLVDNVKDKRRGREELARQLLKSANRTFKVARSIEKAWKICDPYMKE